MKVYCKDCKYCKWLFKDKWERYLCRATKEEFDMFDKKTYMYSLCEGKNKNNDCIDYKRKWYKFWVK